jgi:hypothetical protein
MLYLIRGRHGNVNRSSSMEINVRSIARTFITIHEIRSIFFAVSPLDLTLSQINLVHALNSYTYIYIYIYIYIYV